MTVRLHAFDPGDALALPAGLSAEGLPLSVRLSAGHGQERRLIELAYLLEQAQPFPTLARA